MRFSILGALVACTLVAEASPLKDRSTFVVKDRHYVPHQWSRVSDAPPDHLLRLNIGLRQSKFDELEKSLYEGEIC